MLRTGSRRAFWAHDVVIAIGSTVVGQTATTDATPTTLASVALASEHTTLLKARVAARRVAGSAGSAEDGAGYTLVGVYKMVSGVATLIGAVTAVHAAESQAAWNATFTVSGGNVLLQVTGAANNTVVWTGNIQLEKVHE